MRIRERRCICARTSAPAPAPSWVAPGCRAFLEALWSVCCILLSQPIRASLCEQVPSHCGLVTYPFPDPKLCVGLKGGSCWVFFRVLLHDVRAHLIMIHSFTMKSAQSEKTKENMNYLPPEAHGEFHSQPGSSAHSTGCPPVISNLPSAHKHI